MRILIVSGDNNLFEKLIYRLRDSFVVDTAKEAKKAVILSESNYYDSILVDSVLEDVGGLELCRMMREYGVDSPTAFLSGKEDCSDRLMCFDAGVDVIISRYAEIEEIIAQVNALIRRNGINSNGKYILKIGNISLDMKKRKFYLNSRCVYLRRKEFDLMEYLMIHKDRSVSKEELLEHVWERGLDVMSNTVEVHVRSVRKKFEAEVGVRVVKTHRGFGYEIET